MQIEHVEILTFQHHRELLIGVGTYNNSIFIEGGNNSKSMEGPIRNLFDFVIRFW